MADMTRKRSIIRTYSELIKLTTFQERFDYLNLYGKVGAETFGHDRFINQDFYHTSEDWLSIRDEIILRDNGCDLGIEGYDIYDRIIIHHMNPLTIEDFEENSEFLLDPEYLICTSLNTHNAIHYGDGSLLYLSLQERTPNDTSPWRL